MTTPQGDRHAAYRSMAGGTVGQYNEDLAAASEVVTGKSGLSVNGMEIELLKVLTGSNELSLGGQQAAYAALLGVANWSAVSLLPQNAFGFDTGRTTLPSTITYTCSTDVGTFYDAPGVLQTVSGINEPRFTHSFDGVDWVPVGLMVEAIAIDGVRNNTMVGAVAGTPGTDPTNWNIDSSGIVVELVGTGISDGIDYVDYKFSGTPAGDILIQLETSTGITASDAETWTESVFMSVVDGDLTNINLIRLRQDERTSGGSFVNLTRSADFKSSITSTLQRFEFTTTLSGGGTVARVQPDLDLDWVSGPIDATLRIGLPQMEEASVASSVIKTATVAVTRAADVATPTIADGTYDIMLTRNGVGVWMDGQVISSNDYDFPTGQYPIERSLFYTAGVLSAAQKTALAA